MEISVAAISHALNLSEIYSTDVLRDSDHIFILGEIEDLERFEKTDFLKNKYITYKTTSSPVEGYVTLERMEEIYENGLRNLYYNKKANDWVFLEFTNREGKPYYTTNPKLISVGQMSEKLIASYRHSEGKIVVSIGGSVKYLQNTTLALLPLVYIYRTLLGHPELSGMKKYISKDLVGIMDGYFLGKNPNPTGKEVTPIGNDYNIISKALGSMIPISPFIEKIKVDRLKKFMNNATVETADNDLSDDEVDKVLTSDLEKTLQEELTENKKLFTMEELYNLPVTDREFVGIFRGKEISGLYDKQGRDVSCLVESFIYYKGKVVVALKPARDEEEKSIILTEMENIIRETFGREVSISFFGEKANDKV